MVDDRWTKVDWDSAPLDWEHRTLAGKARDYPEFYHPAYRSIALAIERYLTRFSQAVQRGPRFDY